MPPEISRWLGENGFLENALEQANSSGMYPLILACQHGREDIVETLIEQGAKLDSLDPYGNNALWAACYSESERCIALLVEGGMDLNYQNQAAGATALVYAASSGREQAVGQLLAAGADASLTTHDDFTALDLASTLNILKLLKQHSKRT